MVVLPAAMSDVNVRDAMFCQVSEPPLTPTDPGAVRSRRTVDPAAAADGVHALVLPAPSIERNWARVWPCADTVTALAAVRTAPCMRLGLLW